MKQETEEKTIYRIWDTVEKSFVGNNWTTREAAEEQLHKWNRSLKRCFYEKCR